MIFLLIRLGGHRPSQSVGNVEQAVPRLPIGAERRLLHIFFPDQLPFAYPRGQLNLGGLRRQQPFPFPGDAPGPRPLGGEIPLDRLPERIALRRFGRQRARLVQSHDLFEREPEQVCEIVLADVEITHA